MGARQKSANQLGLLELLYFIIHFRILSTILSYLQILSTFKSKLNPLQIESQVFQELIRNNIY